MTYGSQQLGVSNPAITAAAFLIAGQGRRQADPSHCGLWATNTPDMVKPGMVFGAADRRRHRALGADWESPGLNVDHHWGQYEPERLSRRSWGLPACRTNHYQHQSGVSGLRL